MLLIRGSSINYVRWWDCVILDPFPPSASVRILFFKEDMVDIFCKLLSIKEPQTTLQNKETTLQSYRKMSNKNTEKSQPIEGALFNWTGEMGMDNIGCLNSSLYFIPVL